MLMVYVIKNYFDMYITPPPKKNLVCATASLATDQT